MAPSPQLEIRAAHGGRGVFALETIPPRQRLLKFTGPLYQRDVIEQLRIRAERPNASPMYLNDYAWRLLTCQPVDLRDPQAALAAAQKAVAATGGAQFGYLDTLAKAYFENGDTVKAIETQRSALAALPEAESKWRGSLEQSLNLYLEAAGGEKETSAPAP